MMKWNYLLVLIVVSCSIASSWIERPFHLFKEYHGRIHSPSVTTRFTSTRSTSIHQAQVTDWDEGYQAFLRFIEREGHSNVSLQCKELGLWVRNQRRYHKQYRDGTFSPLTPERLQLLREANFAFDVDEERWLEQYRQLCQFRNDYGHCRVPLTYTTLGQWVSQQRMQYKKKIQGTNVTEGTLTDARIAMLQEKEFIWDVSQWLFEQRLEELHNFTRAGGELYKLKSSDGLLGKWTAIQKKEYQKYLLNQTNTLTDVHLQSLEAAGFSPRLFRFNHTKEPVMSDWDDRMEQLEEFYRTWGHTNVPRGEAGTLGQWVRKVRERMAYYRDTEIQCPQKLARLQDLERINFIWDVQEFKWNKQYERLIEYGREHGHVNVPSAHSDLGLWVGTQRREYAKLANQMSSQLTLRRVQLLEQAGFQWSRVSAVEMRNEQLFQDRLEEYREWRSNQKGTPSRTLALWMERQRKHYRKWLHGEVTALREDRRTALEEIGLVRDIRPMQQIDSLS